MTIKGGRGEANAAVNKLKSADCVYGIHFAHNTDGTVASLTKTTP